MNSPSEQILEKLQQLPPERVAEVADFVDFLCTRGETQLTQAASQSAQPTFNKVWDNPEDAAYDAL